MKAIAIIPARMNSKRFPGKNMELLGGIPLVQWTIEAAIHSRIFSDIYIDSESKEMNRFTRSFNDNESIWTVERDPSLQPYETTTDDIIEAYMHADKVDCYCLLQPTTPFRNDAHIREAFNLFKFATANVVSVNEVTLKPNGGIYMCHPGVLPYDGDINLYYMDVVSSIDINYKYQLKIAEGLLNENPHFGRHRLDRASINQIYY